MKPFAGVAPRIERRHSMPEVAVSKPSPRSTARPPSLEQEIAEARRIYPTAARAGFEDGVHSRWRALELAGAKGFNLFAYATAFVAGRSSRRKPQGGA
jgi:hypothetical protein